MSRISTANATIVGAAVTPTVTDTLMQPSRGWDREAAAHLLRRAAFGGTPEEIDRVAAAGLDEAVNQLIDYATQPRGVAEFQPVRGAERSGAQQRLRELASEQRQESRRQLRQLDRVQLEELRAWWMNLMIATARPLEERMTLLWHGLFTSGHREVRDSTMLFDQNALLRENALARFRKLLIGVSQDPAMLRYLDNASNRKQAPNENYARELLELFTLGVGPYTEQDIKEAARALTGWTIRDGSFSEIRQYHDNGVKTLFGEAGNFDGNDIIDIILARPEASRHLAAVLLKSFLTPQPGDAEGESLAAVIRDTRFDMREIMRALLKSRMFYDPRHRFSIIKGPVELVVGTVRLLEAKYTDLEGLVAATRSQGQELFQPPNVKGWDGHTRWINTATLFARYNFASQLLMGGGADARLRRRGRRQNTAPDYHREEARRTLADLPGLSIPDAQVHSAPQPAYDPGPIIERHRLLTADRVVNHFVDRLLQQRVNHLHRNDLRTLLVGDAERFDPRSPGGRTRVIAMINAILCTPEFQLK